MHTRDLCQELLDHVVSELPEEREAALSLASLATFHPEEFSFFICEAVVLLMRNGRTVPDHLVAEVNRHMLGAKARRP
jgi:hypothetical protein